MGLFHFIELIQQQLYEILANHSGQPYEKIEKDCDRDNWMTAEEAKNYGLVDEVLDKTNPRKKIV